jgi:sugar O-acyltransferase (sialic acid O-acetyltransferase NeuD family)
MESQTKELVIVGDSAFAQIAFEYFSVDTPYEVVAFAVERDYLTRTELFGLPVVAFEDLPFLYPPKEHSFFAALAYTDGNLLRARLYRAAKEMGYLPASYVSPRAFVWRNVELGDHVFVFEGNIIQPFVRVGDNVVFWSGNHVGHHSSIGGDTFVSSHVVISGFVNVGKSSFLGVNSTIVNNTDVGEGCTLGAGALVLRDVPDGTTVIGTWRGSPSMRGEPG